MTTTHTAPYAVAPASPLLAAEILGVNLADGVDEATAHASPNYAVDFGWKTGDFVIWDNQTTWHFAVNDYDGPRAYRKVIGG